MSTQKIFITGSSGKIGSLLIDRLRYMDYKIFLLSKNDFSEYNGHKIKYVMGDLLRPESYAFSLKGVDTVLHLGAVTHTNNIARYYEVNSTGTLGLIRMCKRYNVKRFIFTSTRAISEDGGHYSKSKLIAERYVQESGLDWVIMRLAEVYGISTGKGLDMALKQISRFPTIPIIGSGEYTINPVHISDVISSVIEIIKRTELKNKIYNIAGPQSMTYNGFIDKIVQIRRYRRLKLHIPISIFKIFLKASALFFKDNLPVMDQFPRLISKKSDDISLARIDLDFNPRRIEDMLGSNYQV